LKYIFLFFLDPNMKIRSSQDCRFDILSLGEVMLRLDPGEGRIRSARRFDVWEGGGEYNVARGLSRCFGLKGGLVSAFVRNEVGQLLENLILAGGVSTELIKWVDFDGVGRTTRNGLNFTERGFGVRAAVGISDRGHTAASQLQPGEIDWDHIFGKMGVRWFHTGGIFAALSPSTPQVILEAVRSARKYGTITSYDLNYRSSLWSNFGGKERCREVNRSLAPWIDVMIGNEEDFTACLGIEVEGTDEQLTELPIKGYQQMIRQAVSEFPNFQVIATTLRSVQSATVNDWSALCWLEGELFQSRVYHALEIFDRVGGGDSFASGLIFGLLEKMGGQQAVEYGAAHGALAMTTPGDTSMASRKEVAELVAGKSARVKR
jgi:2-dehydro-3-deoxygluconokinase